MSHVRYGQLDFFDLLLQPIMLSLCDLLLIAQAPGFRFELFPLGIILRFSNLLRFSVRLRVEILNRLKFFTASGLQLHQPGPQDDRDLVR